MSSNKNIEVTDEEQRVKNWGYNQAKMNRSINELINTLNKSPRNQCETNRDNSESRITLNQNSSTDEFRKYLDDLKRNYLEKLTFSCPPKLSKSTLNQDLNKTNQGAKLKSVENLNTATARRSLLYDDKTCRSNLLDDFSESQENKQNLNTEPDLSNTQILSRLVQIREYLKQAYTMLTTLQTSNSPINYSAQMSKLHSLIDHLKDQEKGYMELLNSFSKFQQLNSALYSDKIESGDNRSKLSSSNSFYKRQGYKDDNESEAGSICGSFISDTLTLNCTNNNNIRLNDIVESYRPSINRPSNQLNEDQNELVVIGKAINKINETFEDEKTENDQDVLVFDDDYLTNLLKNVKQDDSSNITEQREEILRQMNTDLDTLEQLREQKQLLRSIRLRKEELKALEGRRIALEALKKIADDGEQELDGAFKILPISDVEHEDSKINLDSLVINRGVQTEDDSSKKPMIRKTFKPKNMNRSNENLDTTSSQSCIEPSSQIEKSKITAKHYEDLIRKILSEKYSGNLVKTVSSCDLFKIEEPSDTIVKDLVQEQQSENDHQDELKSRLNELAEHEKKLEELYLIQSKFANLKNVLNNFNELPEEHDVSIKEEQNYQNHQENEQEDLDDVDDEETIPDIHKRELIETQKQKLINAKEKLKELQGLISRLHILSDETGLNSDSGLNISQSKLKEIQQTEANKALNYLNEIERQRKEEKLEELKRNKANLLEILRLKDQEAVALESLHSEKSQQKDMLNQSKSSKINFSTNDVSYLNEIESKFKTAENGFDVLSIENLQQNEVCHSPSDVLWSQMKKQLNMRENLRNKKKEFEDIIRDEYTRNEEDRKESKIYDMVENFEQNDEQNEIVNGNRDFFLRRRSDSAKKAKLLSEFFDQEKTQQENICPADEIIQDNGDESSDSSPETSIHEEDNSESVKNFVQMNCLNDITDKIENLFVNQQKMNEQMMKNFSDLLEKQGGKSSHTEEVSNQTQGYFNQPQFQTQLQIQQLMFNLNTAYHEISTQRTEISRLNEQMVNVNKQLSELSRAQKSQSTIGINTDSEIRNFEMNSRASVVAALPSYFYNQKKDNSLNEMNDYTDDFEDLDEEEDKMSKKVVSSKSKMSTIQTEPSRTGSSLSSSSTKISSSSCSTYALRKNILKQKLCEKVIQNNNSFKSLTFEKMREQIYSEVATLISQNESRPFYLLNLFKELQFVRDKNGRDQTLKAIFNISNRQLDKLNFKRSVSTTDEDDEKIYFSKNYESQKEADDEKSSQTQYESDSLGNTVIFVKNSPKVKQQEKQTSSSGSSIMGVDETFAQDQETIGNEVKKLISQIISSIKNSDNFDYDDDDKSTSSTSSFKNAIFDLDYLDEIIEKVSGVLRQSSKHCDYVKYYQDQLGLYLKEALQKYEGKYVNECMEDILIEISDILYNELTFYSTMNKTSIRKNLSQAWSNTKNFSNTSSSRESSRNISDKKSEENFKNCKYQGIELLKRLSNILNSKFGDTKLLNDRLMDEQLEQERDKLESLKYDLKKEFESISSLTNQNNFLKSNFGQNSVKYVDNSELESSCCGEEALENELDSDKNDELPYKVMDANEIDETNDQTITVEDLPLDLKIVKSENTNQVLEGLDKLIMDSISDGLVGDPNEMINVEVKQSPVQEESHSLKSDSSNSDNFVIISESNKISEETKNEEGEKSVDGNVQN